MSFQVARVQASTPETLVLYQNNTCRPDKLQRVLHRIQEEFHDFLKSTEKVLKRKIEVKVVDEACWILWDIGESTIKISRVYFDKHDEEALLQDILFEIQNAYYTPIFSGYYGQAKKLGLETFVKLIEWTEWRTTVRTIERLQERGIPNEKIPLTFTYYEDFELFYLYQQLFDHSDRIVEEYKRVCNVKNASFKGTWKIPFKKGSWTQIFLKELVYLHVQVIRTGERNEDLQKRIQILETGSNPDIDRVASREALENYRWLLKKYQNLFSESQS